MTCADPLVALMSANLQHDKTVKNGNNKPAGTDTWHANERKDRLFAVLEFNGGEKNCPQSKVL